MVDWHEYPTNYSNGTEVDGIGKMLFKYPQTLIGFTGAGWVLAIFIAVFGISLTAGSSNAFLVASFITFIFATFLWRLGMVATWILFLLLTGIIVSALLSAKDSGTI